MGGVDLQGGSAKVLGDGFAAEVVDAEVCDVGGVIPMFGVCLGGVNGQADQVEGGVNGQADQVEGGAGAQAAYGATAEPVALPGFAGFHGEPVTKSQMLRSAGNSRQK